MNKNEDKTTFTKVYCREKKKYGIKVKGHKEWWMEPFFDVLSGASYGSQVRSGWFKSDGKFGYVDVEDCEIVIPADYAFPLYFNSNNYAEAWQNHKTGVIDARNNVVIPIIYDELHPRYEKRVFRGFACFTNDGLRQAYDENCQPCGFQEWERDMLNYQYEYNYPENESRTVAEIEEIICKEYVKLLEMGYNEKKLWAFSREHRDAIDRQHEIVSKMLVDRRHKLNYSWVHNEENAKRVARMNDLLMSAVAKAVCLGKKTARSLQWMEKVSHKEEYKVEVTVSPMWQDERSQYDYTPKENTRSKEQDRLIEQEDNVSPTHIWNIIREIGSGMGRALPLWNHSAYDYNPKDWNLKELILDDGQSWDELIHYPAYQDVYFTVPFHHLYCDFFDYALEDLVNMNDFRVDVEVKLQTKESSQKVM